MNRNLSQIIRKRNLAQRKTGYFGKEYEVALLPDSDDEMGPQSIGDSESKKEKGETEMFNL